MLARLSASTSHHSLNISCFSRASHARLGNSSSTIHFYVYRMEASYTTIASVAGGRKKLPELLLTATVTAGKKITQARTKITKRTEKGIIVRTLIGGGTAISTP